jgi:hypothetical protein
MSAMISNGPLANSSTRVPHHLRQRQPLGNVSTNPTSTANRVSTRAPPAQTNNHHSRPVYSKGFSKGFNQLYGR